MPRRTLQLLVITLCACVWDTELTRTSVGGPLSRPQVRASVHRLYENALSWGSSTTYRLEVDVEGRRFETALTSACEAVKISPDRTMVGVQCEATDRQWELYKVTAPKVDGGVGALLREGEPMEHLTWPAEVGEAPPDASWVVWPIGALGVAASIVLLVVVSRRVRRFFTEKVQ